MDNASIPTPDAPVTFREADRDELPLVIDLAHRIWPAAYAGILPDAQIHYMLGKSYSLGQLEADRTAGIRFVLVCQADVPVGFFAYGPSEVAGEGILHKVYLLQHLHGKGIGSLLLREAARRGRLAGYKTLTLTVNRRNAKAIRAYHRNGFVKRAEKVTDIGNGFIKDDFVLVLDLAPDHGSAE